MIDCTSVAKKRRNITVFVQILSVFWEVQTNLTRKDNIRTRASETLCPASSTVLSSLLCPGDSSVGTATRYGLDGLGIETRWGGEIFRTRPDRA
jgi:hypothetical protein